MAYEIPGAAVIGTLNATADLSALQYSAVRLTTDGGVTGSTIFTQRSIGILQNAPTSNQACEIMVSGVSKYVAATTAIVIGDLLMSTALGRGVTWTSGTTAYVFAEVLETAVTTGVMTVRLFSAQRVI